MGRLNLLVKNVFYFGGLKILSSLFPLLLYPYMTKKLANPAEFGLYDIFLVISSLSSSISMLGIQDAMFKQYHEFDTEDHKRIVVSTGFILILLSSLIFSSFLILFKPLSRLAF